MTRARTPTPTRRTAHPLLFLLLVACGEPSVEAGSDTAGAQAAPDATATADVCVPDCAGKACGDDGCGQLCGHCYEFSPQEYCVEGRCQVSPDCRPGASCAGRECGPDPCGGSCGECAPYFEMCAAARCVPVACPDVDFCPCTGDAECPSGVCALNAAGSPYCAPLCMTDCPLGLSCVQAGPVDNPRHVCLDPGAI